VSARRRAPGTAVIVAIAAARLFAARVQFDRAPVTRVEASNDVAWLERIAASNEAAREAQGTSYLGQPKQLRVAAYARLGAIGSTESFAAMDRVERALASQPLTPAIVPLDRLPAVGWHMSDPPAATIARSPARDGITYAIVPGRLLGGHDFFLVSSRTPDDPASWSRPKLVAPAREYRYSDPATLTWRSPRALTFSYGARTLEISIDDVERDADGDGWTDVEEARLGTNPNDRDSDHDGLPDGRDVCPLLARPPADHADDACAIVDKAVFAAFAVTGSRDLLYVTPGSPPVHITGYGGPILYGREIPKNLDGDGGTWVTWKVANRSAADALVQLSDWEGMLSGGGVDVRLKKIDGVWRVVSVRTTWIS